MRNRHLELGLRGENLAADFLAKKGLSIVDRRVGFKCGELDIVAKNGREWVFVEVKTRSHNRMGTPEDAAAGRKALRMERAAREYMRLHNLEHEPIRCDVVAVVFDADHNPVITHYPGALAGRRSPGLP